MSKYKLNAMYVSVRNMGRAVSFYEKLFSKKADRVTDRYSEFVFGKLSFGLYNPAVDGAKIKYGSNCIPSFTVENIEEEYKRISKITDKIDKEIMVLSKLKLFQFKDTEGNIVELYSEKS